MSFKTRRAARVKVRVARRANRRARRSARRAARRTPAARSIRRQRAGKAAKVLGTVGLTALALVPLPGSKTPLLARLGASAARTGGRLAWNAGRKALGAGARYVGQAASDAAMSGLRAAEANYTNLKNYGYNFVKRGFSKYFARPKLVPELDSFGPGLLDWDPYQTGSNIRLQDVNMFEHYLDTGPVYLN